MDGLSEYYQQIEVINEKLLNTPEGADRDELLILRENIEELIALTQEPPADESAHTSNAKDSIDEEYEKFQREMALLEDPNTSSSTSDTSVVNDKLSDLEGKKCKAPYEHQWGQTTYHNAMICSVPTDISNIDDLEVKVLFLNPTHQEMMPCRYYFDVSKECNFSEEKCKYSHGKLVAYSSLQEYIEPKFEEIDKGSKVLTKCSDDLWYRGNVEKILEDRCLVKLESGRSVEAIFEHILPLDNSLDKSDEDSDCSIPAEEREGDEKIKREELINKSLMVTQDKRLGEWEQFTKGIGSKLMQKMGYIVGTGLGKDGEGIIQPVTAVVLPQGRSLDFCMNLKEKSNDPNLFNAEKLQRKIKNKKVKKKVGKHERIEQMQLVQYVTYHFNRSKYPITEQETQLLREKLKDASIKDVNVANFKIEEKLKSVSKQAEQLKVKIKRLEEQQLKPKQDIRELIFRRTDLKRLNGFALLVHNELDRRKNNKDMANF